MVVDFFKNLVRYRVEGVRSKAQAKVYGAKARAKSKASSKFNSAIDKPMNKAKAKAKGMGKKGEKDEKPDKKAQKKAAKAEKARQKEEKAAAKDGGKAAAKRPASKRPAATGGGGGARSSRAEAPEPVAATDSTQVIDISGLTDDRAHDVVGWVVALNGVLRGRDFRLVTGKNVMGTAADCDIVVTDPYLSSKHAVIRHEDGHFLLIDLDSTNGTFVNDRRVSKMELIDNDKIRLGRTEMKFKSLF